MDKKILLSKFKGSVYAALAGDCIGALYEGSWPCVPISTLKSFDEKLKLEANSNETNSPLTYTDDTDMAHVLAKQLVSNRGFDASNTAKAFAETFKASIPIRCYGAGVMVVFEKLLMPSYANKPFKAAKEQFNGEGSYGNGSGMRVFPVALFYHENHSEIEKVAALSAKLTHAHKDAVNGAILQSMAVEFALSSNETTSWKDIWKSLKQVAVKLESDEYWKRILPGSVESIDAFIGDRVYSNVKNKLRYLNVFRKISSTAIEDTNKPYCFRLDNIRSFISRSNPPTAQEVDEKIGTGVKATEAISCAIFSFLYCLADAQPAELSGLNKIQQTIFYAISLGGDTDTIATMAGAIAGAFYGHKLVPEHWLNACEGKDKVEEIAMGLYEIGYLKKYVI